MPRAGLDAEPLCAAARSGDMCGKCAACKKGKDSKQQCLMSSVRWLADRKVYSALVAEMGANAIGARVQVLWQQGPQQVSDAGACGGPRAFLSLRTCAVSGAAQWT